MVVGCTVVFPDSKSKFYSLSSMTECSGLITQICDGLKLECQIYYGLFVYENKIKMWIDPSIVINQYIKSQRRVINFGLKYHPADIVLCPERVRYFAAHEAIRSLNNLPRSTLVNLYLSTLQVLINQEPLKAERVMESCNVQTDSNIYHEYTESVVASCRDMTTGEAVSNYLSIVKLIPTWGYELFPVKIKHYKDSTIGVGFTGIVVYSKYIRIYRLTWRGLPEFSLKDQRITATRKKTTPKGDESPLILVFSTSYTAQHVYKRIEDNFHDYISEYSFRGKEKHLKENRSESVYENLTSLSVKFVRNEKKTPMLMKNFM